MREGNEIAVGRSGERVVVVPQFSTTFLLVETWRCACGEQVEQQLKDFNDQLPRADLSRFLVGVDEGDEV